MLIAICHVLFGLIIDEKNGDTAELFGSVQQNVKVKKYIEVLNKDMEAA